MSTVSRGVVYVLLTAVCVLLLGITALLGVSYHRHQRLEDATIDFQRNLTQQESKIVELQERLENCDTTQTKAPVDSSWESNAIVVDSVRSRRQAPPPKW